MDVRKKSVEINNRVGGNVAQHLSILDKENNLPQVPTSNKKNIRIIFMFLNRTFLLIDAG